MKPKLRFKEFNDEWNEYILQSESDVRDGTHDSPKYIDNGYPLITSKNLTDMGTLDFSNVNYLKQEDFDKINQRSKVDIGDILFGMIGTIGKPVKIDRDDFAIKNVALIKEKGLIKNDYLIHYLHSSNINKQFANSQDGGTQKFIALDKIRKLKINMPSRNEQTKIVSLFDLLDKKIELQSKKIEDLKLFKKGLLKKNYYKIANNNLTELSCIANIYQPQTISQSELDNGKYYVFGANGIIGKYSKFNHKFMQVTISCRGENSGTINLTPDECWITGNSMVLNVDENKNVDKLYLKNILEAQNLKYLISGSGQPQIVRSSVLKHKIPYISIEQQKKFTIPFIKLDSKIKLEQNKLIKLQKLKKGLMQRMFV